VSPCNHRTCHICALRLRALYKNKGCAHCRVCLFLAFPFFFFFLLAVGSVATHTNLSGCIDRVSLCHLHR
jgi:hypothetical protein